MDRSQEEVLLSAGIAHWTYNPSSREFSLSNAGKRLLEMRTESTKVDLSLIDQLLAPADRSELHETLERTLTSPYSQSTEIKLDLPDRGIRWLRIVGQARSRSDQTIAEIIGILVDITESRRTELMHKAFFQQPNGMHMVASMDGTIEMVNEAWTEMLGYSSDELVGKAIFDFVHASDRDRTTEELSTNVAGDGTRDFENRWRHKNGSFRRLSWTSAIPARGEFVYAVARDVTDSRLAEERLTEAAAVFDNSGEGICVIDNEGSIQNVNTAFSRITGYSREEALQMNVDVLRSGRHEESFYETMEQSVVERGFWRGEIWHRAKNGDVHPQLLTITQVPSDPPRRIAILTDIRQLKATEARLQHLAHYDPLTNLANRFLINEQLDQSVRRAKRTGNGVAVMFVDIDAFKHVNDSLGHLAGDLLLQEAANRLKNTLRDIDRIGRIGGDEFLLVLEDIGSQDDVRLIAEKLNAALREPIALGDQNITVSASLGISLYPSDGDSVQELMRNADAAMYDAKEAGRDTYRFYSEQLTEKAYKQVLLDSALRKAVAHEELSLVFQPQYHVTETRVIGVEALLRWSHAELGEVSPNDFIPHAERTGLIRSIGRWVLERACCQAAKWQAAAFDFGRLAVNVSASQFYDQGFVSQVERVLAESGLSADRLELEITESALAQDASGLTGKMRELRDMGVHFSIDDFGTGYSSLSYLKQMPLTKLKLDRSFVDEVDIDDSDRIISSAVIALGEAMGLEVIAEGVETEAQKDTILAMGCERMQGFRFARPMPNDEFVKLLEKAG
ncbi:MAG: EAL domain-containing protein [Pseudomonadota bacterium]